MPLGSEGWLVLKLGAEVYGVRPQACHIPGWEDSLVPRIATEVLSSEDM